MKRTITILAGLLFGIAGNVNAQSLMSFQDSQGNPIANGTEVTYAAAADVPVITSDIECALNGSAPKDINLKRYETTVLMGTQNYFCWGQCYLPQPAGSIPFWDSTDPLFNMQVNNFGTDFKAYHEPSSVVGSMSYRYVWYDMNNPSDSSWLDIVFDATPVGINEVSGPVASFTLFPNPTTSDVVTLDLALRSFEDGTAVILHNALGEEVLRAPVNGIESKFNLNLNGIGEGIYFCSVFSRGELFATERLVVTD